MATQHPRPSDTLRVTRGMLNSELFEAGKGERIVAATRYLLRANLRPSAKDPAAALPWMSNEAIAHLRTLLRAEDRIFEFGAGGSTLFFAGRAAAVTSCEHDVRWYAKVRRQLLAGGIANVELVNPFASREAPVAGFTMQEAAAGVCRNAIDVEAYLQPLRESAEASFDVILVDGRCRTECAALAASRVKPGGYVVLDDSERSRYRAAFSHFEGWSTKHVLGSKAPYFAFHQTSFFRRPTP